MNIVDIIIKKLKKNEISKEEIDFFVLNYTKNQIADYQASALMTAIYLNGLNQKEITNLTEAMLKSGSSINVKANNSFNIIVDKHSSGGVGDKVSLILTPILSALGYDVAKLSGRGLGFTGGTVDKLESVNASSNIEDYQKNINDHGLFLALQTENIVPADKKMYALRDVTGTVDSFALIASSIMSKKLAINSEYIFLDIKVGDGAFCKTIEEAEELSKIVLQISKDFNRKTIIHLTSMDQPLGKQIGNKNEVLESINYLDNQEKSKDLEELITRFVIDILMDTNKAQSEKEAFEMYNNVIESKKALNILINYLESRGSNKESLINKDFWKPKYKLDIVSPESGFLKFKSTSEIGMISVSLGAGRLTKADNIDFEAGIQLYKKNNDEINKGDKIATLYSSKEINPELIKRFINNLFFSNEKNIQSNIIIKKLK